LGRRRRRRHLCTDSRGRKRNRPVRDVCAVVRHLFPALMSTAMRMAVTGDCSSTPAPTFHSRSFFFPAGLRACDG
jgi:hypothetical protein